MDDDWQMGETDTIRKKKKKKRQDVRKLEGDGSEQEEENVLRMRNLSIPSSSRRVSETTIKQSGAIDEVRTGLNRSFPCDR